MGLDNIECREIATKMFLQENQYKLAGKLKRKKKKHKLTPTAHSLGGKREGGRWEWGIYTEHNLVQIT